MPRKTGRLAAWADRLPAVLVNVQRQPGANVIEVVDRVQALLPQLSASLPAAVEVAVLTDRTQSIRAVGARRCSTSWSSPSCWSCS
jgi:multidrug efflux pump